jgi:LGFP repeat-containing protein
MNRLRVLLIVPLLLLGLVPATNTATASPCAITPYGLIGNRWYEMGAEGSALGCALEPEHDVPGRHGRSQTFQWGQIVWSPDQGPNMVLAMYYIADHVFVKWKPTDPLSYDFFIARWDLNGQNVGQRDIKCCSRTEGSFDFTSGPGWSSFVVEGCDSGTFGSTCRQGWTIPVGANVGPPGPINIAAWSATDPAHAYDAIDQRRLAAVEQLACTRTLNPGGAHAGEGEGLLMSAHLELVRRYGTGYRCRGQLPSIDLVNQSIRNTWSHPTGSSFDSAICSRDGDYDTFLKGLMVVAYRYWDLLYPDTRTHVLNDLFTENGPHSADDEKTPVCGLIDLPESENHRLLIESARYLANQKLLDATGNPQFDNVANGMREYLLRNLQNFAKYDFLEYNARPYQRYSMDALLNLYDYSRDPAIRAAAQIVLDYTTSKFALSSNELRRAGPFRRLTTRSDAANQWYYGNPSDPQTAFFLFWTGLSRNLGGTIPDWWTGESVMVGLSTYLPPGSAIRNAMVKGKTQETFYHGNRPRLSYSTDDPAPGIEIYSSSPSYLISAGGVWLPSGYGRDEWYSKIGTNENYGVVQSTTLMPSRSNTIRDNFIRFDGYSGNSPAGRDNVNTCVEGGFACGLNLQVPQVWLNCAESYTTGPWRFLNLNTAACGYLGFYVALHSSPVDGAPQYGNAGFWHAMESSSISFVDFRNRTLQANAGLPERFNPKQEYAVSLADGHTLTFRLMTPSGGNYERLVTWSDGWYLGDFGSAPLVSGTSMSSPAHDGLIDIGDRVLDYRDPLNPVITYR